MGLLVTFLTEIAAPPRVSPSNLVSITPSIPNCSLNAVATFTASCPVMLSTTNNISCGFTFDFTFFNSVINSWSICKRPAVSSIITSFNLLIATFNACLAMCTTSFEFSFANTGIFSCAPTT